MTRAYALFRRLPALAVPLAALALAAALLVALAPASAGASADPVLTAERGENGDTAGVSWTAYTGDGFEYYRVIVCDDSQYDGASCSGTVFRSDAIWDAGSTGPVAVTGLDADTGYGVILQVWRNGSALKIHATLPAPALDVTNVTATTATLVLGNYNGGQWYYQAVGGGNTPNWPPAGSPPAMEGAGAASAQSASANPDCQGPVSGSEASINGSPGNSLVPGSNYTFTAYDNADCQGAGIASAQANSQSNAPAAPANLVGHRGYGLVDAEWTHVDGATGYNVEIYWWYIGYGWHRSGSNVTGGAESTRTHRITTTGSARTPAWMGVPNHGQVIIAVQSVNANGTSGWTYSGFIDTVDFPNRPNNVTAARDTTGDKAGRITVNWGQCNPGNSWCNGRTPITGYSVNASNDNGASWTTVVEAKAVSVPNASLSFCADHNQTWLVSVGVTNRLGTAWSDNVTVGRYTPTPGSRNACEDFDTLSAAGNTTASGIWSNGATMWVLNTLDKKLYAYNLATRARDTAKDISLDSSQNYWAHVTSDGTTVWAFDGGTLDKLFAYNLSTGARDTSKDFTLSYSDVDTLDGLWTDGTTMWAVDNLSYAGQAARMRAYTLSTKARDSSKDFTLDAGNTSPQGVWSDGVTTWVVNLTDDKAYAYTLADGSRDSAKDYTFDSAMRGVGIWSDGVTTWVVDSAINENAAKDKLVAYNSTAAFTSPASVNAWRGWGFLDAEWSAVAAATSYDVEHYHPWRNYALYGADWRRVGSGVSGTSLRITGIKNFAGDVVRVRSVSPLGDTSEWSYSASVDAISSLPRAPQGLSAVRVDASSLTLSWTQCDVSQAWCHGGTPITGYLVELSNDGGKTWRSGGKISAPYVSGSAATVTQGVNIGVNRVRVSAETRFRNSDWTEAAVPAKWLTVSGITSTTATLTIGDHTGNWYYKHTNTGATCDGPVSGTTKNVTDLTAGTSYTYSAYSDATCTTGNLLATAAQFTTPALTVGSITATTATLTVANYTGNWYYKHTNTGATCDGPVSGTTKNLTGLSAGTSYTYSAYSDSTCTTGNLLATAAQFTTPASLAVSSITSTTATLTIAGHTAAWYYKATTGPDATCQGPVNAGTSAEDLTGLTAGTSYIYSAYSDATCAANNLLATAAQFTTPTLTVGSVTATTATLTIANHTGAWYYKATTGPHTTCQAEVAAGTSTASLTGLTGNTSYVYSAYSDSGCSATNLLATAASFTTLPTPGSSDSSKDIDTSGLDVNSIWSDGTTMWMTYFTWSLLTGGISAFDLSTGSRDTDEEFNLHSDNGRGFGIWGNSTTIYVQDNEDTYIYAYDRSTKTRNTSKEFNLASGNDNPFSIWSDGTTMWVTDDADNELYAYTLATGARDSDKDYGPTLSAAGNDAPDGIWSDGTTMWVSDYSDGKLYAYKRSDKSRDSSKDYELTAENSTPYGIWSNGTTMYVADADGKIYAYHTIVP